MLQRKDTKCTRSFLSQCGYVLARCCCCCFLLPLRCRHAAAAGKALLLLSHAAAAAVAAELPLVLPVYRSSRPPRAMLSSRSRIVPPACWEGETEAQGRQQRPPAAARGGIDARPQPAAPAASSQLCQPTKGCSGTQATINIHFKPGPYLPDAAVQVLIGDPLRVGGGGGMGRGSHQSGRGTSQRGAGAVTSQFGQTALPTSCEYALRCGLCGSHKPYYCLTGGHQWVEKEDRQWQRQHLERRPSKRVHKGKAIARCKGASSSPPGGCP